MRHFDGRERFGKRADLIDFDEDGIRHALLHFFLDMAASNHIPIRQVKKKMEKSL